MTNAEFWAFKHELLQPNKIGTPEFLKEVSITEEYINIEKSRVEQLLDIKKRRVLKEITVQQANIEQDAISTFIPVSE